MKKNQHNKKKQNAEKNNTSMTNVHFSDYISKRWEGGKRRPVTIRQNDKLYSDFKPVAKRLYGSVCRAIETFEAVIVTVADENVYFSNTEKPLHIGKIVIERNLRPRRALEVNESVEIAEVDESKCAFCDKNTVAIFRDLKLGNLKEVCSYHAESLRQHPKWVEVDSNSD